MIDTFDDVDACNMTLTRSAGAVIVLEINPAVAPLKNIVNADLDDLLSFFEFIEMVNVGNMVMSVYNEWKTNIWSKWEDVNNCYMNLETI